MPTKRSLFLLLCIVYSLGSWSECSAQTGKINNDTKEKSVVFGNEKIKVTLDYNKTANISLLTINGQRVIQGHAGVYSKIRTKEASYSTLHLSTDPTVTVSGSTVSVMGIR